MEHFTNIEKRCGVDVGRGDGLHPTYGKWRVGKEGFDKNLKLNDMIEIAYTMDNPRPNIIIKAGKNAKWYLKYCMPDKIDEKIEKNKYRDCSRCNMYIITWS
jgi:hypothetical protein